MATCKDLTGQCCNLIYNSSFEKPNILSYGWSQSSGAIASRVYRETTYPTGYGCLEIYRRDATDCYVYSDAFTLLPNTTYTISMDCKGIGGIITNNMGIEQTSPSTLWVCSLQSEINAIISTTEWRRFSKTFTTGSTVSSICRLVLGSAAAVASQTQYDSIKLEQRPRATTWTPALADGGDGVILSTLFYSTHGYPELPEYYPIVSATTVFYEPRIIVVDPLVKTIIC